MSAFDKTILKKVQSLLKTTPNYITLSDSSIILGYEQGADYYQIRYGYFDRNNIISPNESEIKIKDVLYPKFDSIANVVVNREPGIALNTPSGRTYYIHTDFTTMDNLIDRIYEIANNKILKELEV